MSITTRIGIKIDRLATKALAPVLIKMARSPKLGSLSIYVSDRVGELAKDCGLTAWKQGSALQRAADFSLRDSYADLICCGGQPRSLADLLAEGKRMNQDLRASREKLHKAIEAYRETSRDVFENMKRRLILLGDLIDNPPSPKKPTTKK